MNEIFKTIKKIKSEEFFEELLRVIAEKGRIFRPMNYVWDILPLSLKVKRVVLPRTTTPDEISPVLIASFLDFGQILPVWVDKEGNVIDGQTRAAFFGSGTKYLVHPRVLTPQERAEVRLVGKILNDTLKHLAERIGVEFWRKEVD